MAVVFGVNPRARAGISLVALYWQDKFPATLVVSRVCEGVDDAVGRIVGTVGEWGELQAVAVAAPLTWSNSAKGVRGADNALKKRLPRWAPRSWVRSPLARPSVVTVQGMALAWAIAEEIRSNQLPRHQLVECHPRFSLAHLWPEAREDILAYAKGPKGDAASVQALVTRFVEGGLVQLEECAIETAGELDALVAALTALGLAAPDSGLVVHEHVGSELRPVGKRPMAYLVALP